MSTRTHRPAPSGPQHVGAVLSVVEDRIRPTDVPADGPELSPPEPGEPRTAAMRGDVVVVRADRYRQRLRPDPSGHDVVRGLEAARRLVGGRTGRRPSVDPVAHRPVSDGRGGTTWI